MILQGFHKQCAWLQIDGKNSSSGLQEFPGKFTNTTNENKNISRFIEFNVSKAFADLSCTHLNVKYITIQSLNCLYTNGIFNNSESSRAGIAQSAEHLSAGQ